VDGGATVQGLRREGKEWASEWGEVDVVGGATVIQWRTVSEVL